MSHRSVRPASPPRRSRAGALALALLVVAASGALAEGPGSVAGELAANGQAIVLAHGSAAETTMGGDDPVTFVRLTEKPVTAGPLGDIDAISGKGGAAFLVHLRASGKVYQVLALHPKADASFAAELPKEKVKVSGLRIEGGEIAATVESDGEIQDVSHVWKFRFELRLPIQAD